MPIHNKPIFASLRTDRKDEKKGEGREKMRKRERRKPAGIEISRGRKEKENKIIREEEGSWERGRKGEKERFQGQCRDADWRN